MNFKSLLAFGLAAAAASQAAISYEPVNANATEGAKKLYNFLATNFGSRTISGVQTGDVNSTTVKELPDVKAVYDVAGKYPALVGFDFLFANGVNAGDEWYQGYTQMAIDAAANLWAAGGIPAFSWHWKDPSHQIDAFYTKSGNSKEFTTFDYSKGFKAGTTEWDETSETYKQIIADIDEIAVYFKQLQEKGAAAIFRPLHESGGAFFWWSAVTDAKDMHKGAEYAALYRLVHDRMVNVNGVNNLVWVWNAQTDIFDDPTWNPGDSYYDVFSVDIYNSGYDYQSNSAAFKKMQQINGNKILALSENGPIPDASLMHADNAVWSWNMPWYETWDGKFVSKTKNTVWEANLKDPCVFALEDMPGWDNYAISNTPAAACVVSYALGDLDTTRPVIEVKVDTSNGNGWMKASFNPLLNVVDENGDTTVHAAVQLTMNPSTATKSKLAGSTTITVKAFNPGDAGVWFTIASLTGAPSWSWQQAEGGCWMNPGDSTDCELGIGEIDIAKSNTIYILVATENFAGDLYFDELFTDKGIISSFDTKSELFKPNSEDPGSKTYTKEVALIGTGIGKTTAIKSVAKIAASKLSVAGNRVMLTAATAGQVSVDVFGMNGKRVATLYRGMLSAGTHAFDMADLSKGQYIIRVKGAGIAATQPVMIK